MLFLFRNWYVYAKLLMIPALAAIFAIAFFVEDTGPFVLGVVAVLFCFLFLLLLPVFRYQKLQKKALVFLEEDLDPRPLLSLTGKALDKKCRNSFTVLNHAVALHENGNTQDAMLLMSRCRLARIRNPYFYFIYNNNLFAYSLALYGDAEKAQGYYDAAKGAFAAITVPAQRAAAEKFISLLDCNVALAKKDATAAREFFDAYAAQNQILTPMMLMTKRLTEGEVLALEGKKEEATAALCEVAEKAPLVHSGRKAALLLSTMSKEDQVKQPEQPE